MDRKINEQVSELEKKHGMQQGESLPWYFKKLDDFIMDNTVISLFQAQVAKHPNADALVFSERTMSYADLDKASTQLALYVKAYYEATQLETLKPNTVVGIYLDRSFDLAVAILAVLKLSCIYMPISTKFPDFRVNYIVEQAQLDLLITSSALQYKINRIIRKVNRDIVLIDADDELALASVDAKETQLVDSKQPEDPFAYLMYTSGTEKDPKGVLIKQTGLVNLALFERETFSINTSSRVLGFAHCSFDAFAWEFYGALLSGATYVIVPQDALAPGHILAETIKTHKITHVTLPPSALAETPPDRENDLRYVVSAGEALPLSTLLMWQGYDWTFFNAYGPTETTVCALIADCTQASEITLGMPIANTRVVLVDSNKHCITPDSVGEIAIAGIGLAEGYYKNPELTAERFIDLKDNEGKKTRFYLTGDLGRLDASGQMYYLGRKDDQVKLRGYRIELGEIESHALSFPDIAQVVCAVKTYNDRSTLVLFYKKAQPDKTVEKDKLRLFLSQYLVDYMVPQIMIEVPDFPLNANGKIDKKQLPAVVLQHEPDACKGDHLIDRVSKMWSEILGESGRRFDPEDDFFDVGGHSLLVPQVLILIHKHCQVELSMQTFMEDSRLKSIVAHIQKSMSEKKIEATSLATSSSHSSHFPSVVVDKQACHLPFALTTIQQAYYLGRLPGFELNSVSTNIYREFVFESMNIDRLEFALNRLIERHGMLRCVFLNSEQQKIKAKTKPFKIRIYKLKNSDSLDAHLLQIRHEMSFSKLPVDIDPLFDVRATLTKNKTYLHFVIDALVVDGWSFYIFFKELEKYYQGSFNPKPLTLTFRDYVIAYEKIKLSDKYQNDKRYWLNRFDDFPSAPPLPISCKVSELNNFSTATARKIISEEVWSSITNLAEHFQLPKTTVLLSVFSDILHLYSNALRFTINITLFNRLPLHEQVNEIMGDFSAIELLAVNYENRHRENFVDFAKKLQQQLYQDLDHRLFDGVEVQRALRQHTGHSFNKALMPIVFTCFLNSDTHSPENELKLFNFDHLCYGCTQSSQVWLDFKVYEEMGRLIIEWDYLKHLFMPGIINNMFDAYCHFLLKLSHSKVSWTCLFEPLWADCTPMLEKPIKQETVLTTLNAIPTYVMETVKQYPNRTAVISGKESMTYNKLHQLASALASHLSQMDHTSHSSSTLIAICIDKCCQQIVAVLGVLYAGFAYLPIDPEYPTERICSLLSDGKVSAVLSLKKYVDKLDLKGSLAYLENRIIMLDDPNVLTPYPETDVTGIKVLPTQLAYVIYTSGSTGRPKGVMLSHASVVNTILSVNERYQIDKNDATLALSNLNFDLSVYDIFGMLFVGGKIVLPENDQVKDPAYHLQLIQQHQITVWNTVPMFMQLLTEYLASKSIHCIDTLESLRLVLLSGDWIPISLPSAIRACHPNPEQLMIVSLGGATECAIWSIWFDIMQVNPQWTSIPYGYSMPNQRIYVLNKYLLPCPVWVEGEIYIGGMGLALGYWQDEQKTKEQFIPHPACPNERLYKTGDWGRYHPNGYIEFLGRKDNQHQLSGYRVELSEIEYHLLNHPFIELANVQVVCDNRNQNHLIAFINPTTPLISYDLLKKDKDDYYSVKSFDNLTLDKSDSSQVVTETLLLDSCLPPIVTDYVQKLSCLLPALKTYRTFDVANNLDDKLLDLFQDLLGAEAQCDKNTKLAVLQNEPLSLVTRLFGLLSLMKAYPYQYLPSKVRYLYPSASRSYSVRACLFVGASVATDLLKAGYYHFDPVSFSLSYVAGVNDHDKAHHDQCYLLFFSYLPAIEPLYKDLSTPFFTLEAGYLFSLFRRSGLLLHTIMMWDEIDHPNDFKLMFPLHISSGAPIALIELTSKSLLQKNNLKNNNTQSSIELFVYIKNNRITGYQSGLYCYDTNTSQLVLISETIKITHADFLGDNRIIFEEGACVFFLLTDHAVDDAINIRNTPLTNNRDYVEAGYLAQCLMEKTETHHFGFCPIGEVGADCVARLLQITGKKALVHTLIAGHVTPDQLIDENTSFVNEDFKLNDIHLKKFLSKVLPDYMIPARFHFVETMPLTNNGKIDRQKLIAQIDISDFHQKKEACVKPRNQLESEIFLIWKNILNIDTFGVHDHFAYFGGTSLSFVQLLGVLNKQYQIELKLSQIMNNPTIANHAVLVREKLQSMQSTVCATDVVV